MVRVQTPDERGNAAETGGAPQRTFPERWLDHTASPVGNRGWRCRDVTGTIGLSSRRRVRHRRPGESIREAAGHDRPAVRARRSMSAFVDRPDPWMVVEQPTQGEARRLARYDSLVGQLASGRITSATFQRRVSGWRTIRGERFLSDPDRVLAEIELRRASDLELFYYDSGRTT